MVAFDSKITQEYWPVAFAWDGDFTAIPESYSCSGMNRLSIKFREVYLNDLLEQDMRMHVKRRNERASK